jgi:two-component system response regulator (stage 0 sporulation protein F)
VAVVLVVDDDAGIREVLALLLSDEGYSIVSARNGEEALAQIARYRPDVVLLDLMMPVMPGWEVLRALRATESNTRVVFMSAGSNARAEAIAYGADDFLAKPFTAERVLEVVARQAGPRTGGRATGNGREERNAPGRVAVAILNTNDDMLRLLQSMVEAAGFTSVGAHVDEVGRSADTLQEFLRRHDPQVVLYDVSPPYAENWATFVWVRDAELSRGPSRRFLVTTTNKQALEERVGPTDAIELVGERVDRDAIVAAIRRAMTVRPSVDP